MSVEYKKGFKIQTVELFLMDSMVKTTTSLAFFETEHGLVIRKNDIPSIMGGEEPQRVLIGGVEFRKEDDFLYELPCFQDNMTKNETAFTVVKKSDLNREHVMTMFDKL